MSKKVKIITRLVDELTSWLLNETYTQVDVSVIPMEEGIELRFVHYNSTMTDSRIEQIRSVLNQERQIEMETYYWSLIGESNSEESLQLVGRMTDTAVVERFGNDVTLMIYRKKL